MTKPIITPSPYIPRTFVQSYERYLPSAFDESLSILQKINKVIHQLNLIGEITNNVVVQWNDLIKWILEQGLEEMVSAEIDKRIADGTFDELFAKITGKLSDLTTIDKDTLVAAINEVNTIALLNKEHIGDLVTLDTNNKDNLVEAINELKFQVDINSQAPITIGEATGYGIIKGFKVIQQPVLAMSVQIGDFIDENIIHMVNGVRYTRPSIALPISPSSATLDRIDIVYVSVDGVITVKEGVPSLTPSIPLAPVGSVLLAQILINAGDTTVNNIDITDKREMKSLENLLTNNKSNLVQAINEVITSLNGVINDAIGGLDNLKTTDKSNVVNAINELFDDRAYKVDVGDKLNLATINKTNLVEAINEILSDVGNKTLLDTTVKDNLVNAINEVILKSATKVDLGDKTALTTTDKTNIVNAINEVVASVQDLATEIGQDLQDTIQNIENAMLYDESNLNRRGINVLYPPKPLIACKGDGLTDDTVNFNVILTYAIQNNCDVIVPKTNAQYVINSSIKVNLDNNKTISIIGLNNPTLVRTANVGGELIHAIGTGFINTGFNVIGLNIDGAGFPPQWGVTDWNTLEVLYGIRVEGIDKLHFSDLFIQNIYGFGINVLNYDHSIVENIITKNVGGSWFEINAFDSFGDAVYHGYAKNALSSVIVKDCTLEGYDSSAPRLSRIATTFEYGASKVTVQNCTIKGYSRTIHTEDVANLNITLDGIKVANFNIFYYHMGQAQKIDLNNIEIANYYGGDFGSTKGVITLHDAQDKIPVPITISNSKFMLTGEFKQLFATNKVEFSNCSFLNPNDTATTFAFEYIKAKFIDCIFENISTTFYASDFEYVRCLIKGTKLNNLGVRAIALGKGSLNNTDVINAVISTENINVKLDNCVFQETIADIIEYFISNYNEYYNISNCNFDLLTDRPIHNQAYSPITLLYNNVFNVNKVLNRKWDYGILTRDSGDAFPTTGKRVVGDIRYRNNPTADGFIGWVCTESGVSGTWKDFGKIEV